MIPARIEKEVLIEAPVDVVWRILTEPDQISQWLSDQAQLDPKVGGQGRLTWTGRSSFPIQVEAIDSPRRFVFRWVYPEGETPSPRNSTLVEFTLIQEGGRTRLRVVESGFDQIDWSTDVTVRTVGEHTRGWDECLGRLREVAQRQPELRRG